MYKYIYLRYFAASEEAIITQRIYFSTDALICSFHEIRRLHARTISLLRWIRTTVDSFRMEFISKYLHMQIHAGTEESSD